LFLFLLGGCTVTPSQDLALQSEQSPLISYRGTLEMSASGWLFRHCYSKDIALAVNVSEGFRAWSEKSAGAFSQHYVEFLGTPASKVLDGSVDEVDMKVLRLAARYGGSCPFNLTGSWLRAGGESPPWIVDISNDLLRVRYENRLHRLHFPLGEIHSDANQVTFSSQIAGKKPYQLTFTVTEKPCTDSRGDRFPYSTQMRLNDVSVSGCGRDGHLLAQMSGGRYAAKLGDEIIDVYLNSDMSAEVKRLSGLGGSRQVILARGRWWVNDQHRIMVEVLSPEAGGKKRYVIYPEVRQGLFLQATPTQRVRLEPIEGQGEALLGLKRITSILQNNHKDQ
ncbi:MAG: hypothetical protein ACPGPF_10895, partial [Pontibacterium sp.]